MPSVATLAWASIAPSHSSRAANTSLLSGQPSSGLTPHVLALCTHRAMLHHLEGGALTISLPQGLDLEGSPSDFPGAAGPTHLANYTPKLEQEKWESLEQLPFQTGLSTHLCTCSLSVHTLTQVVCLSTHTHSPPVHTCSCMEPTCPHTHTQFFLSTHSGTHNPPVHTHLGT